MAGACFFQKHFATGMKRLHRVTIEEKHATGDYLTVRDARDLVALVQEGVVEIHPWGAKADDPDRPDRVIFDLDPGPRVEWSSVMDTAKALRAHLEQLDLVSFLKTTGGKGLHVVVPVRRGPAWSEIKAFSRAVAGAFVKADPSAYTISPAKRGRERKIFIDYLRNDRGATAVAAYAVRARAKAPVATPLAWDELKAGLEVDSFTLLTVPGRLAALRKNPWSGIEKLRQSISPQARRALGLR
jgi:bifunctional non-homologous end joining protein LigD